MRFIKYVGIPIFFLSSLLVTFYMRGFLGPLFEEFPQPTGSYAVGIKSLMIEEGDRSFMVDCTTQLIVKI